MNSPPPTLEILLASPRGFCAGVDRAIMIVEKALEKYGAPIYVRHEIVHNPHVVNRLKEQGVVFVEDLRNVPKGAHLIFSAHGVSPAVRKDAMQRKLKILDATCPLVTKVHGEAQRYSRRKYIILLIGHREHVEVEGTFGEAPDSIKVVGTVENAENIEIPADSRVAYLTQTTLSLDDTAEIISVLRRKFPLIEGPAKNDICYATQNRQNAVKILASKVELLLVVGAENSSNTLRLVEVALSCGTSARRIESARELNPDWLRNLSRIGITAGASAPEEIVQGIVTRIRELNPSSLVREISLTQEDVTFALPPQLKNS
ncbi:MAG: 4-hydroxy-3-methylbut-2-enyl diphosphate reductase [SAR324 cluster bacterium]|nr:4-hydroxy-3-methylbut-2-enyl diphosphate reductase [SAR324 cluster bacterium]